MQIGDLNGLLLPGIIPYFKIRSPQYHICIQTQPMGIHSCSLELDCRQSKCAGIKHRMTGARVQNHHNWLSI